MAEPLLKEKPVGGRILQHMKNITFPLIRLAIRSPPCPQFGIVVFEQINCSNTRCLIEPTAPRFCLAESAGFGRQFAKLRALNRLRRRLCARPILPQAGAVLRLPFGRRLLWLCDWQTARVYVVLAQSTEAFPLEGEVANAMSRMRCSRRSGVTS